MFARGIPVDVAPDRLVHLGRQDVEIQMLRRNAMAVERRDAGARDLPGFTAASQLAEHARFQPVQGAARRAPGSLTHEGEGFKRAIEPDERLGACGDGAFPHEWFERVEIVVVQLDLESCRQIRARRAAQVIERVAQQEVHAAHRPALVDLLSRLPEHEPVIQLFGTRRRIIALEVEVDRRMLNLVNPRPLGRKQGRQHHAADVGTVADSIVAVRDDERHLGAQAPEQIVGAFRGIDREPAGRREHVLNQGRGDSAQDEAGMSNSLQLGVGVVQVVEDAAVDKALDLRVINDAFELADFGGGHDAARDQRRCE